MTNGDASSTNGKATGLAGLLNKLDITTLAAVMLFGGGNFLATKDDGRATREEQQRVIHQVGDLHSALDDFERRQKDLLKKSDEILQKLNGTG